MRTSFLVFLIAFAVAANCAHAQQNDRIYRIGVLSRIPEAYYKCSEVWPRESLERRAKVFPR